MKAVIKKKLICLTAFQLLWFSDWAGKKFKLQKGSMLPQIVHGWKNSSAFRWGSNQQSFAEYSILLWMDNKTFQNHISYPLQFHVVNKNIQHFPNFTQQSSHPIIYVTYFISHFCHEIYHKLFLLIILYPQYHLTVIFVHNNNPYPTSHFHKQ